MARFRMNILLNQQQVFQELDSDKYNTGQITLYRNFCFHKMFYAVNF